MLSKEGCEKALARIVNDDYYFEMIHMEKIKQAHLTKMSI